MRFPCTESSNALLPTSSTMVLLRTCQCEGAQQSHSRPQQQVQIATERTQRLTEQDLPVLGEMTLEPKAVLTVVVIATAPPRLSATARCEVPWSSGGMLEFWRRQDPPYVPSGCTPWSDVKFLQHACLRTRNSTPQSIVDARTIRACLRHSEKGLAAC